MPCGAILDLFLIVSDLGEFGAYLDIGADLGIQLAICFCFSCLLAVFGSSQSI